MLSNMAVGVVIGGAFGKIVTSLVNDIIMPIVGVLTGGMNFTDYKIVLKDAVLEAGEVANTRSSSHLGTFIADYCRLPHRRILYLLGY